MISRAIKKDEIPKGLSDAFMLGYYYYAMSHLAATEDAGWYAEGVDYYIEELEKEYMDHPRLKAFIKLIREAEAE